MEEGVESARATRCEQQRASTDRQQIDHASGKVRSGVRVIQTRNTMKGLIAIDA